MNTCATYVLAKANTLTRRRSGAGGRRLVEQFMSSLIKNVLALLEKLELLIEDASTRDEILKADKMLNHDRWKAEKLIPSMQATNKSLVELQGAVRSYTV